MAKKIIAVLALAAILSSYYLYRHLSISWHEAVLASFGTIAAPSAKLQALSGIKQSAQSKVWVCPMHPEIMQDHPDTCPICGMKLVEVNSHIGHDHGVHVDTASIQKLGVRLASATRTRISQEIPSYGNVTEDGSTMYNIYSTFTGIIKKTYIHSVGQKIEKGQVIYEIYSPELIMQEKAFISFIERRNQLMRNIEDNRFKEDDFVMNLLQDFSRERSRFLQQGVSLDTVQKIEDSSMIFEVVKIVAAESGVITQINAREGSLVTSSATLFTLANVNKVWVDITLYPDQAQRVKTGDMVTIKIPDGEKIEAMLDFVSPVAEGNKVDARVAIDNSKLHLRPGNFVDVIIHAQPHEALVLPRSAVMHSGNGDYVILSQGKGHFLPVPVETGVESGDLAEITDGLQEGAQVAVNGQFLLDAAVSLHDAAERMQETHLHK